MYTCRLRQSEEFIAGRWLKPTTRDVECSLEKITLLVRQLEGNTGVVIGGWKSGKGRELAIAGKSNVLCRNRALVVPMDVQ